MQLVAALALAASALATAPVAKYFDNYIFVILENNDLKYVLQNPKYAALVGQGVEFTNYHGTTHPSQPNYWSTIAQSTFRGIVDPSTNKTINGDNGDNSYNLTGAPHIGDSLEAAGLNWAIFSENYPGNATNCFIGDGFGTENNVTDPSNVEHFETNKGQKNRLYKRKHNPFVSFDSIYNNPARCGAHVKSFNDWEAAVAADVFPEYSYIVPNQVDDAHDFPGDNDDGSEAKGNQEGLDWSAKWILGFLAQINNSTYLNTRRTLIHITFDENDLAYALHYSANKTISATCNDITTAAGCPGDNTDNLVYGVLLGSAISCNQNTTIEGLFDHNSIVSTLNDNWNLAPLSYGDKTPVWPLKNCPAPTSIPKCSTAGGNVYTAPAPAPSATYVAPSPANLYKASASKVVIGAAMAFAILLF